MQCRLIVALAIPALAAAAMATATPMEAQRRPTPSRIEGVVYDSVSRQPLRLATVQLLRTNGATEMRSVDADIDGQFHFDSVSPGEWIVGAWHARLDSVGLKQLARRTLVESGKRHRVNLAVPSIVSLVRQMCGDSTVRDSLGVIFGTVRRADAQRSPVVGMVRMKWNETEIGPQTVLQNVVGFDQPTTENGEYLACGVPTDSHFQVQASAGTDSSGVVDFEAGIAGLRRLDLFVELPQRRADTSVFSAEDSAGVTVVDTVISSYRRGTGRLDGVAQRDGFPLPGALVTVWGTGLETRSDDSGRFTLLTLPLGTHMLEMRAIGYEPLRRTVDVFADSTATVAMNMERAIPLDTMRIRAWARRNDYGRFKEAEFLKRKQRGPGVFIGPDEMARLNPASFTQLFTRSPSLRMQWSMEAGETVTMGMGASRCTPAIMLDDRVVAAEDFFMMIRPSDLIALEIYPRNGASSSLSSLPGSCGAIVAWTGVRPPVERFR